MAAAVHAALKGFQTASHVHTSAGQGLPLVLIFLNKLHYSKDFFALI